MAAARTRLARHNTNVFRYRVFITTDAGERCGFIVTIILLSLLLHRSRTGRTFVFPPSRRCCGRAVVPGNRARRRRKGLVRRAFRSRCSHDFGLLRTFEFGIPSKKDVTEIFFLLNHPSREKRELPGHFFCFLTGLLEYSRFLTPRIDDLFSSVKKSVSSKSIVLTFKKKILCNKTVNRVLPRCD